jgi:hypothetical protein
LIDDIGSSCEMFFDFHASTEYSMERLIICDLKQPTL